MPNSVNWSFETSFFFAFLVARSRRRGFRPCWSRWRCCGRRSLPFPGLYQFWPCFKTSATIPSLTDVFLSLCFSVVLLRFSVFSDQAVLCTLCCFFFYAAFSAGFARFYFRVFMCLFLCRSLLISVPVSLPLNTAVFFVFLSSAAKNWAEVCSGYM